MIPLPKALWPRRESVSCFHIPNVAVGRIALKDALVPVFSAFYSHGMFLPPKQWTLVHIPSVHRTTDSKDGVDDLVEAMEACQVEAKEESPPKTRLCMLMDPSTLHMIGNSLLAVYVDADKTDSIVALKLFLPEGVDPDEHWCGVGERYKTTYEYLQKHMHTPLTEHVAREVFEETARATPMIEDEAAVQDGEDLL